MLRQSPSLNHRLHCRVPRGRFRLLHHRRLLLGRRYSQVQAPRLRALHIKSQLSPDRSDSIS